MKWTKSHSKNAVQAKARKRMEPLTDDQIAEIRRSARHVRSFRSKSKWRIQITDCEHRDSLTLNLYRLPWPGRYIDADHRELSASKVSKVVHLFLTQAP